ncbi:MAG: hypothetical protein U5L45_22710 [Saprospiraceae bacterium]|nr:hypothetical protein [Saprospiraceae bacterium]
MWFVFRRSRKTNHIPYKGLNPLLLILRIYAENAVGMNDFVGAHFNAK